VKEDARMRRRKDLSGGKETREEMCAEEDKGEMNMTQEQQNREHTKMNDSQAEADI
jgi:hypothetical protein